jgi:hypothetical protein
VKFSPNIKSSVLGIYSAFTVCSLGIFTHVKLQSIALGFDNAVPNAFVRFVKAKQCYCNFLKIRNKTQFHIFAVVKLENADVSTVNTELPSPICPNS